MLVLDTNVVSELVRTDREPELKIASWISSHRKINLYLTAVNRAELLYGIAIMPLGRRRSELRLSVERWLDFGFRERILPFDDVAAQMYAKIAASRRSFGKPIGVADCQIAAITRTQDAILVTRNVRDFEDTGIEIVNPWLEL